MAKQPSPASPTKRAAAKVDDQASERRKSQPDGRKGILVRAKPEAWKSLKLVALDQEKTLQDVMTEAINDVLKKYGKPPVA